MRLGPFIEKQWGNRLPFLSGHCQFSLQHKGRDGGGGKGAEIIAGLLKETVLHETIMAKEGISFCEGEGVCLRAWVLWGRRWMQRG